MDTRPRLRGHTIARARPTRLTSPDSRRGLTSLAPAGAAVSVAVVPGLPTREYGTMPVALASPQAPDPPPPLGGAK